MNDWLTKEYEEESLTRNVTVLARRIVSPLTDLGYWHPTKNWAIGVKTQNVGTSFIYGFRSILALFTKQTFMVSCTEVAANNLSHQ